MAWDWNDILSGYWQEVDADSSGEVDTAVFLGGWSIALLTWPLFTSVFSKSIGILLWGPNLQQIRERESSIGVCWRSYTVIPGPSVYVFPSQKYVSLDGSWRCASWEGGSWRHTETPPIVWWESPVWSTFFFSISLCYLYSWKSQQYDLISFYIILL